MKRNYQIIFVFGLLPTLLGLTSCKQDSDFVQLKIQKISGQVQKGPFITGSSVSLYDLQSDFVPSGKSYNSLITDNNGTFQYENITLSSNFAVLRADGFYFNEVSGKQSIVQITLNALVDLSEKNSVNVNLLTHLEKPRVEYLIKDGKSFTEAKFQAQNEILGVFGFQYSGLKSFEDLNIGQNGEDNGKLLAITAILQGNHNEAELTELLTNISEDLKVDGKLDSPALGSELINQSRFLDTTLIKTNLSNRYHELGLNPVIPEFGKYIKSFINTTKFEFTSFIEYPLTGKSGINILTGDKFDFSTENNANQSFSVTAKLPRSASLKVKLIPDSIGGGDFDPIKHILNPVIYAQWGLHLIFGEDSGWEGGYDTSTNAHIIKNTSSERIIDTAIDLLEHGSGTIEIYENNQASPTRKKHVKW
jgi:hypothetical protein